MVNVIEAWNELLQTARERLTRNEILRSPIMANEYSIVQVNDDGIQFKLAKGRKKQYQWLLYEVFRRGIDRLNRSNGRLKKTKMVTGRVVFETAIVELLSSLQWVDNYGFIVEVESNLPAPANEGLNTKNVLSTETVKKVKQEVTQRMGQPRLRKELLLLYCGKCCISGYSTVETLCACHIIPFNESHDNDNRNALLLRSDIHDLFDSFLLGIKPESLMVEISPSIEQEYGYLRGIVVADRSDGELPRKEALQVRWNTFLREQNHPTIE